MQRIHYKFFFSISKSILKLATYFWSPDGQVRGFSASEHRCLFLVTVTIITVTLSIHNMGTSKSGTALFERTTTFLRCTSANARLSATASQYYSQTQRGVEQWFSTLLMLQPLNTAPCVVVIPPQTMALSLYYFMTAILLMLWILM